LRSQLAWQKNQLALSRKQLIGGCHWLILAGVCLRYGGQFIRRASSPFSSSFFVSDYDYDFEDDFEDEEQDSCL